MTETRLDIDIRNLNCFTKDKRHILKNVGFQAKAGEFYAILGPSGSGKSTLLNFIGNQAKGKLNFCADQFKVNSQDVQQSFWRDVRFVQQEDQLHGFMTPRQLIDQFITFNYGMNISAEERTELIDEVLAFSGLKSCKDQRVGDMWRKGVSGGQKRRLSIALELISKPSVLLLDKPTSGIDSNSAFQIMSKLKAVASKFGAIVVASIQHPNSDLWKKFDRILLISKGYVMYEGKTQNCLPVFEMAGFIMPEFYNPADFILKLVNKDFDSDINLKELQANFLRFKQPLEEESVDSNEDPQQMDVKTRKIYERVQSLNALLIKISHYQSNSFVHFFCLLKRDVKENVMNPGVFGVRLLMYTILSLLVGLVFGDLKDEKEMPNVTERIALLFYVAAFFIFMSIAAMPFFVMQRAVFEKEQLNNLYSGVPYVFAHTIAGVPGIFVISLISSLLIVFICGLENFHIFLFAMFLTLLVAEQIAVFYSILIPHYIIGMALVAGLYGFFMLVEGFMMPKEDIPDYLEWTFYLAVHSYSFRAFMVNEFEDFGDIDGIKNKTQAQFYDDDTLLEWYYMEDADPSEDLAIILCYFLIVFIATVVLVVLKYKRRALALNRNSEDTEAEKNSDEDQREELLQNAGQRNVPGVETDEVDLQVNT